MAKRGHEIRLLDSSFATVGVLYNPFSDFKLLSAQVRESVEAEDEIELVTADFEYETQLTDDDATYYIRTINFRDSTDIRTYHITEHEIHHQDGRKAILVRGERIWIHLRDRYIYPTKRDFVNISISTLITEILAGSVTGATAASSEFQAGTIATSSETVDFFSVDAGDSPLAVLRKLNAKMGREMILDESTSPITIDFPATIGNASSVARLRYGTNLRSVRRKQDFTERVTRMYAIGGGVPPAKLSDSTLTANDYIDSANFDATENHFLGVYRNAEIFNVTNRIADASNPDLSGTYTAGLCAGWSKIGSPTVSENTDDTYFTYGTKSQKVVAADGEGVSVSFTANTSERMVGWLSLHVESMDAAAVIRLEFTDADGVKWLNGEGFTTTGSTETIERQGMEFTSATGTLKVYADGGNATFHVDAAMVHEGDQFRSFVVGNMVDVLYNEANNALAEKDGDTAAVTYDVDGIDLFELDPLLRYPDYQIALGDTITVEDYDLPNIQASLRVKERTWNVVRPEANRFQVGKVIKTLSDVLTSEEAARRAAQSRERSAQDRDLRSARTTSLRVPTGSLLIRFSGTITSDAYDGFTWGAGTLRLGNDVEFAVSGNSASGLTASTSYYLYFDRGAPGSGLQTTTTFLDTVGPKKHLVAFVRTHTSSEAGCSITRVDGVPQLSGDDIITGTILANLAVVRAPGASSAQVRFNGDGIQGFNASATQTFDLSTDGSGYLGNGNISWTTAGVLTVAGGIVTSGIDADNITTGTIDASVVNVTNINADNIETGKLSVGTSPTANDRIDIDWATQDVVLYRGGSAVADFGDITETGYGTDVAGLRVNDPDGMVVVRNDGGSGNTLPYSFAGFQVRSTDEASTGAQGVFSAVASLAARTTGNNGVVYGYFASIDNDDGLAQGAQLNAESDTDARGLEIGTVEIAGGGAGSAYGIRTDSIVGGASGNAYAIYIANSISGGGSIYAIYNAATEDNYLEGSLGIGDSSPTFKLDVNGDGRFVSGVQLDNVTLSSPTNAIQIGSVDLSAGNTMLSIYTEGTPVGSGTPTQDRTVAVDINGTTLYLLAATSAT